jgi:hypothetical protein
MRVELVRNPDSDRLVVYCRDPVLAKALVDLYFRGESGRYEKTFPPGSVTESILNRFQAVVEPLLRQTAGIDAVPWPEALREGRRRLDAAGVGWWLAGSAALAVQGLPLQPRDLDLVISDADVQAAATVFADALIEPAHETQGWISRWFGRAWLGARVEWVAGVSKTVDLPTPCDFGPAAGAALVEVQWEGSVVRVPPIDLQREMSVRRGLDDRVALIDSLA